MPLWHFDNLANSLPELRTCHPNPLIGCLVVKVTCLDNSSMDANGFGSLDIVSSAHDYFDS